MANYTADVEREGEWLVVRVTGPGFEHATQCDIADAVPAYACDLITTMTGTGPDSLTVVYPGKVLAERRGWLRRLWDVGPDGEGEGLITTLVGKETPGPVRESAISMLFGAAVDKDTPPRPEP